MPIQRAAYLWVCSKCRQTAKIICGDGTPSRPFITQKFGLELADGLAKEGRIADDELKILRGQIRESNLLVEHDVAEHLFQSQQSSGEDETERDDPNFRINRGKLRDPFWGGRKFDETPESPTRH